jgi:hypothetical protein
MNEITSTELDLGNEAKKNGRGYGTAAYEVSGYNFESDLIICFSFNYNTSSMKKN